MGPSQDRPSSVAQGDISFYIQQLTDATYLLDMLDAGSADEDRVAIFALHQTVVRDPTQGNLSHGQVVLVRHSLDLLEGLEVWLVPVSVQYDIAIRFVVNQSPRN